MGAISDQDILDAGFADWFRVSNDLAVVVAPELKIIGKSGCVCVEITSEDLISILKVSVSPVEHAANLVKLATVLGWGVLDATQIQSRSCALLCALLQL
jgi:hypothetical protein